MSLNVLQPMCRHCQRLPNRCRGLCWVCYHRPEIRQHYPLPPNRQTRCGHGSANRRAVLPPTPTDALPGSEEKIQILAERARLGQQLFHPDDRVVFDFDTVPTVQPTKEGWHNRQLGKNMSKPIEKSSDDWQPMETDHTMSSATSAEAVYV